MKKLILSVLLIMGPVLVFGYLGKPVEMGIVLFAGFACSVIINIEKFNSFRAGELEATIRHAEEVITDANATIDELKSMTEPMMNFLLAHIARGSRIMGVDAADKEELYVKLKANIEKFELQNEETPELLKEATETIILSSLFEVGIAVEAAGGSWESAQPINDVIFRSDKGKKILEVSTLRTALNEHPSLYNEKVEERLINYERVLNEYLIQEST